MFKRPNRVRSWRALRTKNSLQFCQIRLRLSIPEVRKAWVMIQYHISNSYVSLVLLHFKTCWRQNRIMFMNYEIKLVLFILYCSIQYFKHFMFFAVDCKALGMMGIQKVQRSQLDCNYFRKTSVMARVMGILYSIVKIIKQNQQGFI